MSGSERTPLGFTLSAILHGHERGINRFAWSPSGEYLVSPLNDGNVRLWKTRTHELVKEFQCGLVFEAAWFPNEQTLALAGTSGLLLLNTFTEEKLLLETVSNSTVACSFDGKYLASGSNQTVTIRDMQTKQILLQSDDHTDVVTSVAWSPDGLTLASSSADHTIKLWNAKTGLLTNTLLDHSKMVHSVTWSTDGRFLASGSSDATIRIWEPSTGRQINILEGHTSAVICVSFSARGHLLASKSHDGTVRCWRTDRWETVAILNERLSKSWNTGLAFHPKASMLATLSEEDISIRMWTLDPNALLGDISSFFSVHYTNAKVVLVGDTGVGKSGLGLVLTGQRFMPTESTHGRNVWMLESEELIVDEGKSRIIRETLLWDLAGQPGYRLIHQLHLNEIAVALVVFDNRSETDPLAGIDHWVRALRQGQRSQGNAASEMKMFLVAARVDRSGRAASPERIKKVLEKWGFDGYFETSAKEKWNIQSLSSTIKNAIQWELIPRVSSTDLFQLIKGFLHSEIGSGNILSTEENLYRQFLTSHQTLKQTENLRQQFSTCIGRVASRGLIQRLSFGDLVLLQPEILDAYASALVNAVKTEPDGLGYISEDKVKAGNFALPTDARLQDEQQEKLLLIAMIENLLRYEIALREATEQGPQLVFPSQSTRENPTLVDPEGKAVIFRFEGSVLNVYTTLAVRLSHSGFFQKETVWKNAMLYTTKRRGMYGLLLKQIDEGIGEFVLFFDKDTSEDMRYHFEEYVHAHLRRRVVPESIQRRYLFSCPQCKTDFTEAQVTRRLEKGDVWIRCSVCDTKVSLQEKKWVKSSIPTMDQSANSVRDKTISAFIQESFSVPNELGDSRSLVEAFPEMKFTSESFDVFLSYRAEDRSQVKEIGEQLRKKGVLPWLDEWELQPGLPWQRIREQQLTRVKSAAVFVGETGIGPWQQLEIESLLRQFVGRGCPVIPVLLSDAPTIPSLPLFLEGMTWVDFRVQDPKPIEHLIWGITGKRSIS